MVGKERITVSLDPEEAIVLQWLTVKYPEVFTSRTAAATALLKAAIAKIREKFEQEIEEYRRRLSGSEEEEAEE